jgi:DNA segregation ATPase FtsK/SpoIIIE-like protein
MLFTSAEYNKPKRVQGAFIGEKEVKRVVDFFKQQAGAVIYNEEILEKLKKALGIPGMESDEGGANQKHYKETGTWRGSRLSRRLPLKGRTKTNSRTTRGNVRHTMGSGRAKTGDKT